MQAIQFRDYGPPEQLELVDPPRPVPGPGEILVDIHAASVTPLDCKLRAGSGRKIFPLSLPKIPGRDGAGTIAAIGEDVPDFAVGDRVCIMAPILGVGTYIASRLCTPSELVPIPHGLSFAEAASLVTSGLSAWISAIPVAAIQPGMKLLVHAGAGAVGGVLIQLARHLGAEVSTTCSTANLDYVQGLGAHHAIAYDRNDFSALRGFDVVFDFVGGETHALSHRVVRDGGHLVYLLAAPIIAPERSYPITVTRAVIEDAQEPVAQILDLAASGVIRPQIADEIPLALAALAHRRMETGAVSRGRLILIPD